MASTAIDARTSRGDDEVVHDNPNPAATAVTVETTTLPGCGANAAAPGKHVGAEFVEFEKLGVLVQAAGLPGTLASLLPTPWPTERRATWEHDVNGTPDAHKLAWTSTATTNVCARTTGTTSAGAGHSKAVYCATNELSVWKSKF